MKPKTNRKGSKKRVSRFDECQTPWYGVDPLLQFLPRNLKIWEPACGKGMIAAMLKRDRRYVIQSDLRWGSMYNFFTYTPRSFNAIVTNPPYSIKYPWIERCYELGVPFALLMPLETLGAQSGQKHFSKYGMELIVLDKRINFKMPRKGYTGNGAQFPVAWFTYGLGIGREISYAKVIRYPDGRPPK